MGHVHGIAWATRYGIAWYRDDVLRVPMGGDGWREVPHERLMTSVYDPAAGRWRDICVLLNGEIPGPWALAILDEWDTAQLAEARASWGEVPEPLA